jgi:rubrerythrin
MSYQYFQEHKDELIKTTTEQGKTAWVCTICGYVYYGEELPDDFTCPICGVTKDLFVKKEN